MTRHRDLRLESDEPPPRPRNEERAELGFVRKNRMVRWLSPTQLFHTGRQALFAVLISGFTDKREIEAALPRPTIHDRSEDNRVWIDFISDLGDGFNPTYTLASLLAKESLDLSSAPLPRGSILVMGGDQVYPAASQDRYRDHVVGPFRAALPYLPANQPALFVLPGNHDWFDGLTSFMRVFCQQGWIGGWSTRQTRSYFAIKLPDGWWLWGIDIQFDNYIDWPQLTYFRDVVSPEVQQGDGVILCVAKPSWVDANVSEPINDPDLYTTLDFFERETIFRRGASVPLAISGDRHHYARYEGPGGKQLITCGGGGAFLSETHALPETIAVPPPGSSDLSPTPSVTYTRARRYPEGVDSLKHAWLHAWSLLWRNDAFPLLVGAVAVIFAFLGRAAIDPGRQPFWGIPDRWWRNALTLFLLLGLAVALVRFTKTHGPRAWALGVGHFLLHMLGIVGTIWLASTATSRIDGSWHVPLTLAFTFVIYGVLGSELFALYLLIADRFAVNRTELFAAMRIQDRKSFLRIRVDAQGCTIYPVKVDKVPRRWQLQHQAEPGDPWFVPMGDPPVPELIEEPITIQREPVTSPNWRG